MPSIEFARIPRNLDSMLRALLLFTMASGPLPRIAAATVERATFPKFDLFSLPMDTIWTPDASSRSRPPRSTGKKLVAAMTFE